MLDIECFTYLNRALESSLAPIVVLAPGLAVEVRSLVEQGMSWVSSSPPLPAWITGLPLVGGKIGETWNGLLAQTPESSAMLMSYAEPLRQFLTGAALGLASSIMDLSVALIVATAHSATTATSNCVYFIYKNNRRGVFLCFNK